MDILRITTAGSVDDGKSTLIGRLLFDTKSLPNDKLEAIEATSRRKGLEFTDLSLITDGLIAEREQGITIDVAYIYFSTPNRKFIIADTPGHIEYTRNMITGASTASVFLILIDARQGITEQTRRHFYIASLLRIKEIAVCVNKMDLVNFDREVFTRIKTEFIEMSGKLGIPGQDILFIPMVAKDGDNVVNSSNRISWYKGPTLLEFLEIIEPSAGLKDKPSRFPVQHVIRPHNGSHHDFRGYSGRVTSGSFREGDEVVVLPTLKSSRIRSINVGEEKVRSAHARDSVVITLEDDVDISRGHTLVLHKDKFCEVNSFTGTICWMSEENLSAGKMLLVQHGSNTVKAKITAINSILDIHRLEAGDKKQFDLNDIGDIQLKLAKPIFADAFEENPANGSFILIDEYTNNTVGVGFIRSI